LKTGQSVVVTTERGTELGRVSSAPCEVSDADLCLSSGSIKRVADVGDLEVAEELYCRERDALPVFRDYIEKNEVDMKPIDIEILFGEEKMIFYFAAEHRVDFRMLVRDLASHFRVRIDMRQVGVRDEARMVGGLGHYGEALCCARMGGDFLPVSIKMAKEQGLPLNPTKISGLCGRLMCCLRYEVEAYKDFSKRAPCRGSLIATPRGEGKVVELDTLREIVKLQFADAQDDSPDTMDVNLGRICCAAAGGGKTGSRGCPCSISETDFADMVEEAEAARGMALSATGLGYKTLTSTQGTESAIDNGEVEAGGGQQKRSRSSSRSADDKATHTRKRSRRRPGRGGAKAPDVGGQAGRRQSGGAKSPEAQGGQGGDSADFGKRRPARRRGLRARRTGGSASADSSGGRRDDGSGGGKTAEAQRQSSMPDTRIPRRRRRIRQDKT
jgi:cell fate regulator YaaT (PSP1 superfamily)